MRVGLILLLVLVCGCSSKKPPSVSGDEGNADRESVASSPDEAIQLLEKFVNAKDPESVKSLLDSPWDKILATGMKFSHLHKELDSALQEKFGKSDSNFHELAEQISAGSFSFPGKVRFKVVEKTPLQSGSTTLTLEVKVEGLDRPINTKMAVRMVGNGWKLKPSPDQKSPQSVESSTAILAIEDLYKLLKKEVLEGKFQSRWEVEHVLVWHLINNSNGFISGLRIDKKLASQINPGAFSLVTHVEKDELVAPLHLKIVETGYRLNHELVKNEVELLKRLNDLTKIESKFELIVNANPEMKKRLYSFLTAVLDSGIDYTNVRLLLNEGETEESIRNQFSGRLRLFSTAMIYVPSPKDLEKGNDTKFKLRSEKDDLKDIQIELEGLEIPSDEELKGSKKN